MPRILKTQVSMIVVGVMLAGPRTTFACSVCMGRGDDVVTQGLNAAVLTLLAALSLVLGSVVGFIAYLIRRSAKHPMALPGPPGGVVL